MLSVRAYGCALVSDAERVIKTSEEANKTRKAFTLLKNRAIITFKELNR